MRFTRSYLVWLFGFLGAVWFAQHAVAAHPTSADKFHGPLRVHPDNPRYFTDDSGRAVYLTGSHTWLNLQDGGRQFPPPKIRLRSAARSPSARKAQFLPLMGVGKRCLGLAGFDEDLARSAAV